MAFGLGRGLEALIPNKKPVRPNPVKLENVVNDSLKNATNSVMLVAVDKILPNPHQPRKRFSLDQLQDLATSIKQYGILEPLVVSPSGGSANSFILIAGERRLRAAEMAGVTRVPVIVRESNSQEKLELALIENIQREDLNPLEEAKALKKLLRDFSLNQNQIATRIGRSRVSVTNCLRLLELAPEVQRALLENRLSEGHAKALLFTGNHLKQIQLMREIEDLHLSVRQTERLVKQHTTKIPRRAAVEATSDPVLSQTARTLGRVLGTRVQLVSAPRGGRIVIEYYSQSERERIVKQITSTEKNSATSTRLSDTERELKKPLTKFSI